MKSNPITSWKIEGEKKIEAMTEFIFLGFKITVDGDCNHEIHLLPGRKAMRNPDAELKNRDITLLPKIKAIIFPVVMYGYESWIIKQAECQRIDAFELWC